MASENQRELSLIAAVNKKRSNVPVFFIYAGIIHAIGLALLLPMLITLPGPSKETAPKSAAIEVEIVPAAPSAASLDQDDEQTSALQAAQPAPEGEAPAASAGDDAKPSSEGSNSVANVSPEAEPEAVNDETPTQEEPQAEAETKSQAAKPAKATPATVKKPAAKRYRAARPAARRSTKLKIAPFNGALTGLFTPGAPPRRR